MKNYSWLAALVLAFVGSAFAASAASDKVTFKESTKAPTKGTLSAIFVGVSTTSLPQTTGKKPKPTLANQDLLLSLTPGSTTYTASFDSKGKALKTNTFAIAIKGTTVGIKMKNTDVIAALGIDATASGTIVIGFTITDTTGGFFLLDTTETVPYTVKKTTVAGKL